MGKKMTFALAFCNRGFMPGELIYGAREDMVKAVTDAGYDYIAMDAELTRYGGIETRDEGLLYAKWLKEHEGQYDGVIFSMPIFADVNGAITALQDAGVPILMQARTAAPRWIPGHCSPAPMYRRSPQPKRSAWPPATAREFCVSFSWFFLLHIFQPPTKKAVCSQNWDGLSNQNYSISGPGFIFFLLFIKNSFTFANKIFRNLHFQPHLCAIC